MDRLVTKINKLIVRVAGGNTKALEELFVLTRRMLLAMAQKYVYDTDRAEDVVSDTYAKVVAAATGFDRTQNGLNWIYKILRNTALNYNRKAGREIPIEDNRTNETQDFVDDLLTKITVQGAMQILTEQEKQLLYWRYWQGLSLQEIADCLHKPLTTTYDFLKRTLKKLQDKMK